MVEGVIPQFLHKDNVAMQISIHEDLSNVHRHDSLFAYFPQLVQEEDGLHRCLHPVYKQMHLVFNRH